MAFRVAAAAGAVVRVAAAGSHAVRWVTSAAGAAAGSAGTARTPRQLLRFQSRDDGGEHWGELVDPVGWSRARLRGGTVHGVETVLPPADPPAIFAVGLNYADHAAETKLPLPRFPIVFSKSINTLLPHNGVIVLPSVAADEVDYEAELAVIIGADCRNATAANAMDFVAGYTIANDVTARKWQGKKGGGQWTRSKCFDTFLPLGPFLVPKSEIADPHDLKIRTTLNGDLVQDGHTGSMVVRIPELIAFLSASTTLLAGSVILTGTPAGVGYVRDRFLAVGDEIRITIDGLGTLANSVAAEAWGGAGVVTGAKDAGRGGGSG